MMTSSQVAEKTDTLSGIDEFRSIPCHVSALSPAALKRKKNKPLIEKRRRARINDCLVQLKSIITKEQTGQRYKASRLEKADILELTVDYIKEVKESSKGHDPETNKAAYENGFSRCLQEINTFLVSKNHDFNPGQISAIKEHCNELLHHQLNSISKNYDTSEFSPSDVQSCSTPSPLKRRKTGTSTGYDSTREESPDSTESQHPDILCSETHFLQENANHRFHHDDQSGEEKQGHDSQKVFVSQSTPDTQTISSSTNNVSVSRPTVTKFTEKHEDDNNVSETSSIKSPISLSTTLPIPPSISSKISSSPPITSLTQSHFFFTPSSSSPSLSSPSSSSSSAAAAALKSATHLSSSTIPACPISLATPSTPSSSNSSSDSGITVNKEDREVCLDTPHFVSTLNVNLPSQPQSDSTVSAFPCNADYSDCSSKPCFFSLPGPIFIILNPRNDSQPSPDTATIGQENDQKGTRHSAREKVSSGTSNDKERVKGDTNVITTVRDDIEMWDSPLQFYKPFVSSNNTFNSISNDIYKGDNNCFRFPDENSKSGVNNTFPDKNSYTCNLKLITSGDDTTKRLFIERCEDSIRVIDNGPSVSVTFDGLCKTGIKELLESEAHDVSDKISEEYNPIEQSIDVTTSKMKPMTLHAEYPVHDCNKPNGEIPQQRNFISGNVQRLTAQNSTNFSSHSSLDDQRENLRLKLQTVSNAHVFFAEKERSQPSVRQLNQLHGISMLLHDPTLERQREREEAKYEKEMLSLTSDNSHYDVSQSKTNTFQISSNQLKDFRSPQPVEFLGSKSSLSLSLDSKRIESENIANHNNTYYPPAHDEGEVIQSPASVNDQGNSFVKLPSVLETHYQKKVNDGGVTLAPSASSTGNIIVPFLANLSGLRNESRTLTRNYGDLYPYGPHEASKMHFLSNLDSEKHASEVLDLRVQKESSPSKSNVSESPARQFDGCHNSDDTGKSLSMNTAPFASGKEEWENMNTSKNTTDALNCMHKKEDTPSFDLFTEKVPGISISSGKSRNVNDNTVHTLHNPPWTYHSPITPSTKGFDVPKDHNSNRGHKFSRDSNNNNIILIQSLKERESSGIAIAGEDYAFLSDTQEEQAPVALSKLDPEVNQQNGREVWRPW